MGMFSLSVPTRRPGLSGLAATSFIITVLGGAVNNKDAESRDLSGWLTSAAVGVGFGNAMALVWGVDSFLSMLVYAAVFGLTAHGFITDNLPLALVNGAIGAVPLIGSTINALGSSGRQSTPLVAFSILTAGALASFISSSVEYKDDSQAVVGIAALSGIVAALANRMSGGLKAVVPAVASVGLGFLSGDAALSKNKDLALASTASLIGLLVASFTSSPGNKVI